MNYLVRICDDRYIEIAQVFSAMKQKHEDCSKLRKTHFAIKFFRSVRTLPGVKLFGRFNRSNILEGMRD